MKSGFCVAVLAALACIPVHATAILTLGNIPQPNEENILFTTIQSSATVSGFTNQPNAEVQFTSSTDTLVTTAVGQANLTALDGLINSLIIMVPLGTYGDLIMNPFNGGTSAGPVTVTVVTNDGIFNFSQTLEPGENFMTLTTANGERILSTAISSTAGFADFRQPRISGVTVVPEPGNFMTMAIIVGMAGFVGLTRKHRKKALSS